MLLGEALGEEEVAAGRPFVGRAGKHLDRIINRTVDPVTGKPLRRSDFTIINCISCRPPGNFLTGAPYEAEALEHCRQYVDAAIATAKPGAIVALGNQAMRATTGQWGIEKLRGYLFETPYGPVVPTMHPSALIRSGGKKDGSGAKGKVFLSPVVQYDILSALRVAREGLKRPAKRYILHPSPIEALRWAEQYEAEGCPPLSWDLETPDRKRGKDKDEDRSEPVAREDDPSWSCIYRISFSYKPNEAITFPWQTPYTDVARRLLASGGDKIGWNVLDFDVPRAEHHGAPVSGPIVDGLEMWHYAEPHLPAGLKYVANLFQHGLEAWKLKQRENPELYSCFDSDLALIVVQGVEAILRRQGRWEAFERYVILLVQELKKITAIGVRTDGERRAAERSGFEVRLQKMMGELQLLVPEEQRPRTVFKISKARILKSKDKKTGEPLHEESALFPVWEEVEVKAGWMVNEEGDLVKIPKEKKPRGKRAKAEGSSGAGGGARKRRVRAKGEQPILDSPQAGEPASGGSGSPPRIAA